MTKHLAEIAKQASAMLKRFGFDPLTGAKKDKHYRRQKRAEQKKAAQRWRERIRKLGKFGPASPVRTGNAGSREKNT